MKKIIALGIIGMFLLTSFAVIPALGLKTTSATVNNYNKYDAPLNPSGGYTPRHGIHIYRNEDFNKYHGVTGGSGTEEDPYIIEGWKTPEIRIYDTTAYFIIRNCYVNGMFDSIKFMNVVNGVIEHCITFTALFEGIELISSDNNIIRNCEIIGRIQDPPHTGIWLLASDNNIIHNCDISRTDRGIEISDGRNNVVHHNNFFKNIEVAKAFDYDGGNQWDDGKEGNYWSDYEGVDEDGNGIGDTPYIITDGDGNPTGQDNFPLMKPVDRTKSKSINPVVNLLQRYPLLEKLFLHPIFIRLLNLL